MDDSSETSPGPLRKAVQQVQEAAAAVVGMVSASTLGSHSADAFAKNATIADLYEIEAGRLALERTSSPDIQALARTLVLDHTRMSRLRAKKAPALGEGPGLDQRRQGLIDHLKAASGDAFDKLFLQQQAAAHQEAVTLHQGFIKAADSGPLLGLASAGLAGLKQHLAIVTGLLAGQPFRTAAATVGNAQPNANTSPPDRSGRHDAEAPVIPASPQAVLPSHATASSPSGPSIGATDQAQPAGDAGPTYGQANYNPSSQRSAFHTDQYDAEPPTFRTDRPQEASGFASAEGDNGPAGPGGQ